MYLTSDSSRIKWNDIRIKKGVSHPKIKQYNLKKSWKVREVSFWKCFVKIWMSKGDYEWSRNSLRYLNNLRSNRRIDDPSSNKYSIQPQKNGTIEAFNKVLDNALRKVCNVTCDNWDEHVPIVLWAYRTRMKILTKYTSFRVIYGKGTMMPMDFLLLSLCVVVMTKMIEEGALK